MLIPFKQLILEGYTYGDILQIVEENSRNFLGASNIIEERSANYTSDSMKQAFNNTGNKTERIAGGLPYVGPVAGAVAGYRVSNAAGGDHPITGIAIGREGVMGAASNNVNNINVKDVYTKRNLVTKGIMGAIAGGLAGGLAGTNNDILNDTFGSPSGSEFRDALEIPNDEERRAAIQNLHQDSYKAHLASAAAGAGMGAIGGATAYATLSPGIRYGLGKLVGRRYGDRSRNS